MVRNLKKLRNKKKISQQQLADIIGVSQQSINKYENHSVEPDIETLIKLSEFFQTSVDYLIGHTEVDHIIEKLEPFELNDEEKRLITNFRRLTAKQKKCLFTVTDSYFE